MVKWYVHDAQANVGLGDNSFGKVLAVQASGPEFDPKNLCKKPGLVICACTPSARGEDRLPVQIVWSTLQAPCQQETLFQNARFTVTEEW